MSKRHVARNRGKSSLLCLCRTRDYKVSFPVWEQNEIFDTMASSNKSLAQKEFRPPPPHIQQLL
jgi:hypothetical protein